MPVRASAGGDDDDRAAVAGGERGVGSGQKPVERRGIEQWQIRRQHQHGSCAGRDGGVAAGPQRVVQAGAGIAHGHHGTETTCHDVCHGVIRSDNMNTVARWPLGEYTYGVREHPEHEHVPFLGVQGQTEPRFRCVTRADREHGLHVRQ